MKKEIQEKDYQKAIDKFEKRYLPYKKQLLGSLEQFSPDLADIVIRHGLYEVWEEKTPLLSYREKEIATLSSLITENVVMAEIIAHTENCLIQGMTKAEIIEILIVLTLYIGVPKVINVLGAMREAFSHYDEYIKNKG